MKEVRIKSLKLINFKAHKETVATFSDYTTITGDNGTGKSTVFDAFLWALFGKDQFDRKDFEIIPTINGKMLERVDSTVEVIIEVDGREFEISRTLHQKWVRRKGTAVEVYDGCETLYKWNGVDKKAGEYKALVDMVIEETIFKLITKPDAFLSMHWTKMREFLFQMAGTISNAEILDRMATLSNKDAIFNLTNILNQGKNLTDFKKEIAAAKKKAKDELETVQPRIDQTVKLTPEAKDFVAIEAQIATIEKELQQIDEQIADRAKAIRGQYDAIQEKQREINSLKMQQTQIANEKQQQRQQEAFRLNQERNNLQNEFSSVSNNLKNVESVLNETSGSLQSLRKKKETKEKELEQLRSEWDVENAKEYVVGEKNIICPLYNFLCDHPKATLNFEQAQEVGKKAFIAAKDKNLDELDERGVTLTGEIKYIESRIQDAETYYKEAKEKADELNNQYNEIGHKLGATQEVKPEPVIASELPEWQELEKQIQAIEKEIEEVKPADGGSDYNLQKAALNSQRDELKKQLSDRELIAKCNTAVNELEARGKELAQQIADLESQEFSIDSFNRVRIEECESRINGMFDLVRFKLFETTNDGNEFEACVPTNVQGVPYAATNTASQINMGLDIIRVLSRFYNVSAPVFIDRAESVNIPIPTGSQMVFLKVTAPGTPFNIK